MKKLYAVLILTIVQIIGCSSSKNELRITDEYAYFAKDSVTFIVDTMASYQMKTTTIIDNKLATDSSFMMRANTPEVIYKETIPYSDDLKNKFEGEIDIKVWVSSTGKVLKAYLMRSTNVLLNKLALEASLKWKFKPATYESKPLGVWVKIPFRIKEK